jgi:hypothetical protein
MPRFLIRRARMAAHGPESGLTLVELIIAATMSVVIVGAATAMLITALQRQGQVTQGADQVGDARTAVEKMVTQVRQGVVGTASVTNTATTSTLQMETYVDTRCGTTSVSTGTKCKVVFQCASEICSRTTGTGTTSTERIVSGVKNASSVFEPVTGPSPCVASAEVVNFVEVRLELKTRKGNGVTRIQDGAGLRSCS